MSGDRVVGPIFQESANGDDLVESMKDVAATGHTGQGAFLASANAGAEIGNRGLGSEATFLQFLQTQGPGAAITLVFGTQQEAVGGADVGANENGLPLLKDLVEAGDFHVGEMRGAIVRSRLGDGIADDVVHRA